MVGIAICVVAAVPERDLRGADSGGCSAGAMRAPETILARF
jgi:hypothetical protein